MALLAPRFRSHALLGLPARLFSATTGLVAARAGPPGATAPRSAAARTAPAARRDTAAGTDAGRRCAPRARADEDRLAAIAATFVPSCTILSPPGCWVRRRDQPCRRGSARPRGGERGRAARGDARVPRRPGAWGRPAGSRGAVAWFCPEG